jgi:hypothetical protein
MGGCRVVIRSHQDVLVRDTNAYHGVSVSGSYHHYHHALSPSTSSVRVASMKCVPCIFCPSVFVRTCSLNFDFEKCTSDTGSWASPLEPSILTVWDVRMNWRESGRKLWKRISGHRKNTRMKVIYFLSEVRTVYFPEKRLVAFWVSLSLFIWRRFPQPLLSEVERPDDSWIMHWKWCGRNCYGLVSGFISTSAWRNWGKPVNSSPNSTFLSFSCVLLSGTNVMT